MSAVRKIRSNRFFSFVAACFVAFSASPFALAQSSSNDEDGRIIALEQAWNRAIEAKDTKALDQILAPTFVGVDIDGSVATKSQFLAGIKHPSYQPAQAAYEDIHAEIYGDTAITTGVFRIREIQKGKRITMRQRFIDTWVKKGQTWQCVASQVVLIPEKEAK